MSIRYCALAGVCMSSLVMAGCSVSPFGREAPRQAAQPRPVAAAPTGAVTAAPLPPPSGMETPATGLAALDPSQAATPAPGSGNVAIGRPDLLGSWTISAAGDSCQLTMALTTWTGGYRASTRGCSNDALQGISAWNLEGQQVQLLNDSGATVARLYPASKTQFNGQTEGGGPVSFSR